MRREPALLPPTLPARLPDNTNFSNPAIPLGARESGTKLGYSTWQCGDGQLWPGAGACSEGEQNKQSLAVGGEEKRGAVPF